MGTSLSLRSHEMGTVSPTIFKAGVRQLRKLLDKVSRKVALSMVRKKEEVPCGSWCG